MSRCHRLLWVDCVAGATVGAAVLLAAPWLAPLFGLPLDLLYVTGAANVGYAAYSFSLAVRTQRSRLAVLALVVANGVWPLLCVRWIVIHWDAIAVFGLAQLVGEAVFVGGLAALEWRCREELATD